MAFISSAKHSIGNGEVNTASSNVPTASTNVTTIDEDDMEEMDIKWNMALLSMRADKAPRNQDRGRRDTYRQGSKAKEQAPKALMAIDGVGWDWSYMANDEEDHALVADEEAPIEFALMANTNTESKELENLKKEKEVVGGKLAGLLTASKDLDNLIESQRPSPTIESSLEEDQNRNPSASENVTSPITPKQFVKFVKASDSQSKTKIYEKETPKKPPVKYAKQYIKPNKKPNIRGNQRNWNNLKSHQLGNISYLSDYEPFDGGYVSFGQGGCKITRKGTIKTSKLEFENVYFVKDLKYNLFSVSQICDNKNSVLFTYSECIVLGRDFKLLDDANILLRTPRQHNMYSIDLNNIVPHKDLTCLVAKASADECNLWHMRLGFLKPFGCHVMILNTLDNLGKFEEKGDEGYFLGYSMSSKAFRVFNKRTKRIEENFHIEFLENKAIEKGFAPNWLFDIDSLTKSMNYVPVVDAGTNSTNFSEHLESTSSQPQDACNTDAPESSGNSNPTATSTNPPADQLDTLTVETPIPTFEDILGVTTNLEESKGVEADVRNIETTIIASPTPTLRIHRDHPKSQIVGPVDTLIQTRNKSKESPRRFLMLFKTQVRTKWVLKNKKDERGIVIRNKARLVAQGHTQEEEIDYDEVFAPVARIEAIKLFLAYASFMGFTRIEALMHEKFQMSAMGELNFFLGLQVLQKKDGIFLSQDKYVGDILKKFRYSDVRSLNTLMDKENPWGKDGTRKDVDLYLYRSMIESLMYLTASRPDIMFAVCACARHQVTPKECHLHAVKRIFRYLKGHLKLGLLYPKDSPFNLVAYSDSDYGGATQDCKSTSGGCQFLDRRLISWQCKKQTIVATSTTESEYVAAASCCGQVLLSMSYETLSKEISTSILHLARIAQSSTLPPVADEPASPEVEINRLKERVILEDKERVIGARSSDDAPIKEKRINEEEVTAERLSSDTEEVRLDEGEVATKRTSKDTEEMATVLTTMNAATVLVSGAAEVPIGSGSIPTTGAEVPTGSDVVPTASPIFATATVVTPYRRRKGKEGLVESKTLKKQKLQKQIDAQVAKELEEQLAREDQKRAEQIARDAEIARIHAEEELQSMIESLDSNNETVAKYLEEYRQFSSELPMERRIELISDLVKYQENYTKAKDFKGMTFKEVEVKFNSVCKQMEDFIPMGSKEEAERIKRKEVTEEKIKEMIQLVPIEEVYVEALQVKHPIIDWEVHTEGQRAYWKITSTRPPTSDKEMELWVELSRLYEPDKEDQLLSSQKRFSTCDDQLQASSGELLTDDRRFDSKDIQHCKFSKIARRIVGNKMNKAFPLLVRKFPLPKGTSHCLKKKNATARRKVMPLPEDCTAVIVKKKLSVKDESFLKISALCPALYSSNNCKL
uniref:Ribonuclease H-like domain, reverse transcriptase, RNA-dependent DNA polymerase n=1 Tax=Tanacetum cinerariifolium TaxID=118510 RepID=A0A6L2MSW8_TANCI|nr:ribonuclease H-like domain, reverse transcriptase, RNA-dependent DNA polymerase [Tanacetum cinerariifolium]